MTKCRYRIELGEYVERNGDWNCELPVGEKCPNVERLAHKCIIKSIPRPPKRTVTVKAESWNGWFIKLPKELSCKAGVPCTVTFDKKYLKG